MTEEEYVKKISKYSKKEIIEAILKLRGSLGFDLALSKLLTELETTSLSKLEAELDKLQDERDSLFVKYNEWLKRMADRYGDGHIVKVIDIPTYELEHGKCLSGQYEKARADCEKIEKKIDSFYVV